MASTGLAALALAACGGGGEEGASAAGEREGGEAQFREVAVKHARCMRRNGVDVPDPKPGKGGAIVVGGPDSDPGSPSLRRAQRNCSKLLKQLPEPPELSSEDEREFRERALKHARCMRAAGIEFPDPSFGRGGRVQVRLPDGVGPGDERFRAAEKRCSGLRGGIGAPHRAPGR
jgi:hypothetical protein